MEGVLAPFRGTTDEVWTGWGATMAGPVIGGTHDWSADGTRCVYATNGIRVLAGGASYFLRDGAQPQWNPVTNEILYVAHESAANPAWEIRVMGPGGEGDRLLVADPANTKSTTKFVDRPFWSPRGTWAGYLSSETQLTSWSQKRDVWVVPAGGTGARNLTNDATSVYATPVAWR
jgi:hypothetical protein